MTKNSSRDAFTMVEVLVASVVFAMMAISLLSYVQYGSEVWKRGHQRINVSSYFRAVSSAIQRDLQQADKVISPIVGQTSSSLKYDMPIFKNKVYANGTGTLALAWSSSDHTLRRSLIQVKSPPLAIVTGTTLEAAANSINRERYEFIVARDVATFTATRVSSWTMNIAIGIESNMGGDDGRIENMLATMSFVIPAGR